MNCDLTKTLDELEKDIWGEPSGELITPLVARCHRLRTKPLGMFSPGDLRIMIGQEIGLRFLIPLAIQILQSEPYIEGDYFPGDLLANVLRLDKAFWRENPHLYTQVQSIYNGLHNVPPEVDNAVAHFRNLVL